MYQWSILEKYPKASWLKRIITYYLSQFTWVRNSGAPWTGGSASRSLVGLQSDAGQHGSHLKAWLEIETPFLRCLIHSWRVSASSWPGLGGRSILHLGFPQGGLSVLRVAGFFLKNVSQDPRWKLSYLLWCSLRSQTLSLSPYSTHNLGRAWFLWEETNRKSPGEARPWIILEWATTNGLTSKF